MYWLGSHRVLKYTDRAAIGRSMTIDNGSRNAFSVLRLLPRGSICKFDRCCQLLDGVNLPTILIFDSRTYATERVLLSWSRSVSTAVYYA